MSAYKVSTCRRYITLTPEEGQFEEGQHVVVSWYRPSGYLEREHRTFHGRVHDVSSSGEVTVKFERKIHNQYLFEAIGVERSVDPVFSLEGA